MLRPWLILCLNLGLAMAAYTMKVQKNTMHEHCEFTPLGAAADSSSRRKGGEAVGNEFPGDKMIARRGELLLSPVGTAYCPLPAFKYLLALQYSGTLVL